MARPQNFNESDVVDAAMMLFWEQGYVATGMSQLLKSASLKPGSFYNRFSGKKGLFIRSLEYYNEKIVAARIQEHLALEDPRAAIESFFVSAYEPVPRNHLIGCLLTNTATELGKMDREISAVVWSGLQQIKSAFKRRIIDAQQTDSVRPDLDPEATSLHLLSCFQGLNVIGRLTRSKPKMRQLTHTALAIL